jgi:hypothetical protein
MTLSKTQIEEKQLKLNEGKTKKIQIETKISSLVEEVRKKYSITDDKISTALQSKITALTEQKATLAADYEVKCDAYMKLEEEAGL